MAKCPVCNSRKGKRKCQLSSDNFVCSLCCGTQRVEDQCAGCSFYQPPRRKYDAVPAHALHEMDGNFQLEERANCIESALVAYDMMTERKLSDADVMAILDQLLDIYHFGDALLTTGSSVVGVGAIELQKAIKHDLPDVDNEALTKILGTVRASVKRRSKYGRDYLTFISQFVGGRVGPGMRLLS